MSNIPLFPVQYPQEIIAPPSTTTYDATKTGTLRTAEPIIASTTYNNREVIAQGTTGYPAVLFSEQLFGRGTPMFVESVEPVGTFSPASLQPPLSVRGSTVLEKGRMIKPLTFTHLPKIGIKTNEPKIILGEQKPSAGKVFDGNTTASIAAEFIKRIADDARGRNTGENWENRQILSLDVKDQQDDARMPKVIKGRPYFGGHVFYQQYRRTYYDGIANAVRRFLLLFDSLKKTDGSDITATEATSTISTYLYTPSQTQVTLSGLLAELQSKLSMDNASRTALQDAVVVLYGTHAVRTDEFFVLYRYKDAAGNSSLPVSFSESGRGRFTVENRKDYYTDQNPLFTREYDQKTVAQVLKNNSTTTADDLLLAIQELFSSSSNFAIGNANFISNVLPETMTAGYAKRAVNLFARLGIVGLTEANRKATTYRDAMLAFKGMTEFSKYHDLDIRYIDVWETGTNKYAALVINNRGLYANLSWLLLSRQGTTVIANTYPITMFTKNVATEETVAGVTTKVMFSKEASAALYPFIALDPTTGNETVGRITLEDAIRSDAMFFETLCALHNLLCQITRLASSSLLGDVYNNKVADPMQQYLSLALLNSNLNMFNFGDTIYRIGVSGLTASILAMQDEFRMKTDNALSNILAVRQGQSPYNDTTVIAIGAMSYKKTEFYSLFEQLDSFVSGFQGDIFTYEDNAIVNRLLALKNNQAFLRVLEYCLFNEQFAAYFDVYNAPFFARTTASRDFANIGDLNTQYIAELFRAFFEASEVTEMLRPPFRIVKPIATSAFRHFVSFDDEERVTALYALEDSLLVGTNKAIYGVYGNTSETVRQTKLSDTGVAYAGMGTVGNALLFVSGDRQHLYAYSQYQYQAPNQAGGVKYFLQDALPFFLQDLKARIYKFISYGAYGYMLLDNGRLFYVSSNGQMFGVSEFLFANAEGEKPITVADIMLVERPVNTLSSNPLIERGLLLLLKQDDEIKFGYYSSQHTIMTDEQSDTVSVPVKGRVALLDIYKGALQIKNTKSVAISGKHLKTCKYGVSGKDRADTSRYGDIKTFDATDENSSAAMQVSINSGITANKNVIIETGDNSDVQISTIQIVVAG